MTDSELNPALAASELKILGVLAAAKPLEYVPVRLIARITEIPEEYVRDYIGNLRADELVEPMNDRKQFYRVTRAGLQRFLDEPKPIAEFLGGTRTVDPPPTRP